MAFYNINGLQTSHKYLLYFDGIRNTKASFSVTFNIDSTSNPSNTTTVTVSPNPVLDIATVKIDNTNGSVYNYALFDITGKLITTGKVSILQTTQTFPVYMNNLAHGMYVLRVADENGKVVSKNKILKL